MASEPTSSDRFPEGEPSAWENTPTEEPAPETTDVTQESPEAQDMSEPAPGPQTKDPREFLESEPAYGDSDRPEQADDEDAGLGLDSVPATDPAGGPPRDPDLGVDEQAPHDLDR
jgi:hypothetical protein